MATTEYYRDILREIIARHPWIVALDVLPASAALASRLLELGAHGVFALGASRGTGPVDAVPPERRACLGVEGRDLMHGIRTAERALEQVPAAVQASIDAFDPDRRARVIRSMFSDAHPVAERPTYGARPPAWALLEDKLTVDALWDAVGIPRAPSQNVEATEAAVLAHWERLNRGAGVVLAGDNREGWHGGAHGVRYVASPGDLPQVLEDLTPQHDRVRVMPFLEGVPCSIHGFVLPERVISVRPNEMVVLREAHRGRFRYAGSATFWDPPNEGREEMRALARRVGAWLGAHHGFRGGFTVDGVLTTEGFRPTELNARFGGAMWHLGGPDLPMFLLHLAMVEAEPCDWKANAFEELLVRESDANRAGNCGTLVCRSVSDERSVRVCFEGGQARVAQEDEPHDGTLTLGPGAGGGLLRFRPDPARTPRGPSLGPRAAAAYALADALWDTGIGRLRPAG